MNDRAERTAHNRLNRQVRAREDENDKTLALIMSQSNGRRLVFWLLELGRPGHNPFSGNALTTAFNCGEMNIAQRLTERLLRVCPDFYITMLKEMENERRDDAERYAGSAAESGEPADDSAAD